MTDRTLFLAYGNPDRQDDGVSWYILQKIALSNGIQLDSPYDDFYDGLGDEIDYFFILQLTPELVDLINHYDRVCFLDAHLGEDLRDIHIEELSPNFEPSTLSHHMTPQFLLDISMATHQHAPKSILASVRGYEFAFVHGLSDKTIYMANKCIQILLEWIVTNS